VRAHARLLARATRRNSHSHTCDVYRTHTHTHSRTHDCNHDTQRCAHPRAHTHAQESTQAYRGAGKQGHAHAHARARARANTPCTQTNREGGSHFPAEPFRDRPALRRFCGAKLSVAAARKETADVVSLLPRRHIWSRGHHFSCDFQAQDIGRSCWRHVPRPALQQVLTARAKGAHAHQ